jgi:predicted acylesterase/phospholipase RssA
MGAINGIAFSASYIERMDDAVIAVESIWNERTFKNTFSGSIPRSFLKAIQITVLRYNTPGPYATSVSVFDPAPLREKIDSVITQCRRLGPSKIDTTALIATIEGTSRKPLLLASSHNKIPDSVVKGASFELMQVDKLSAAHGLGSAALPSVLPAVDLDLDERSVRLVDGGICDNHPVDPTVRLGANTVILIDSSGRKWWHDHYDEPHDTKPSWEVPSDERTYCLCPRNFIECTSSDAFGPILKEAVGRSTKEFIRALGHTWPIFKLLKMKMGEDLAYEVMSYIALHPEYTAALIEHGYREGKKNFGILTKSGKDSEGPSNEIEKTEDEKESFLRSPA